MVKLTAETLISPTVGFQETGGLDRQCWLRQSDHKGPTVPGKGLSATDAILLRSQAARIRSRSCVLPHRVPVAEPVAVHPNRDRAVTFPGALQGMLSGYHSSKLSYLLARSSPKKLFELREVVR
jgi:hypothetical protein